MRYIEVMKSRLCGKRRKRRRRRLAAKALLTFLWSSALLWTIIILSSSSLSSSLFTSSFFDGVPRVEGVNGEEEGEDALTSLRSFKTSSARHHHHHHRRHRGDASFVGGGGGRGSSSSSANDDDGTLVDASAKTHGEEVRFPLWHALEYPTPSTSPRKGQNEKTTTKKEDLEEEDLEEEFVKIGFISGTIVVDQRKGADVGDEKFRVKNLKVHRDELDARAKRAVQALAKRDGMYRVRVPSNIYASQESGRSSFAQAASPAKCVVTSRLRESFTLHMDDNGNVLAVDYEAECPVEVHLGGADEERSAAEEEKEGASLFIADGAQFRSVATARFPKRAPQLNADAAMTDVKGHGGPMDAKKAQEIKTRRARGEKVDATTKDLTWWQRNYMWVIPVAYFMFMNAVQGQPSSGGGGGGGGSSAAPPPPTKKSN